MGVSVLNRIDKTIWRRTGLIAILLPVCFLFPLAFFLVIFLLWTIYEDLKSPKFPSLPPPRTWRNARSEDDDWLTLFCEGCESPAEEQFLRAMVAEFDLKPDNGVLKSTKLTLELQVEVSNYRFDFLANGRQVIEVDGAAYHSSPEQVERDRVRDEYAVQHGYKVLRIPANVVFKTPSEAIGSVKSALAGTPTYTKPKIVKPPAERKSISHQFNSFVNGLDEIYKNVEISATLKEFHSNIEKEDQFFQAIEKKFDWDRHEEAGARYADFRLESLKRPNIDHLTYLWKPIAITPPSVDISLQSDVDRQYVAAIDLRVDRLSKLSQRCAKDKEFTQYLCEMLLKAGFPTEEAIKIVPRSAFLGAALVRELTARVGWGPVQQTENSKPEKP